MTLPLQRPWLVTGAAGFLGSHVVEQLIAREIPVVAVDNLSWSSLDTLSPFSGSPHLKVVIADIRDASGMKRLLSQVRPRVVVHLAALHYIPAAVADPQLAVSINVHGAQSVLSAALPAGAEQFFFASTGDVYAPSETPHKEESTLEPFNIYGLSKLQGEQLIALTSRDYPDVGFVLGRLFNLYGSRETNPHILPEIMNQLRKHPQNALRLGNLWPRRDLVPVSEAARAIIEMFNVIPRGVTTLNVATGVARSMQEVIDMLEELLGKRISVEVDPSKVRSVERPHLQADVTRLANLLGWTPNADLRFGLAELLAGEGLLCSRTCA